MPSSRAPRQVRVRRQAERRARRYAALAVVSAVVLVTLLLTAFGTGTPASTSEAAPAPPQRLVPPSRPRPQVVAAYGALRLHLPIAQARLTAVGYHAGGAGALELDPVGRQGNRGLLRRFADRLLGNTGQGLVYYRLDGDAASALDVGAAPDTDVFSPVDGTVVGITPFVLSGKRFGARIEIQPSAAPALVVSVTRLRPDPALTVGSSLVAARTRLGALLDLSHVERQTLARYTQDAGNHVTLDVRAAPTLVLS